MRPDISCEMKPASEKIRKHLCIKYDLKSQYIGLTFALWTINYLGIIGKLSKAQWICVLLSMAEYRWLPWLLWLGFVNWVGGGNPSKRGSKMFGASPRQGKTSGDNKKLRQKGQKPAKSAISSCRQSHPWNGEQTFCTLLFAVATACCVPWQIPVRYMKEHSEKIC